MSDFLPFTFLLGLTQLIMCAALVVKASRWLKLHPRGANPEAEFTALQFAASAIGLMLTIALLYFIKLPSWDALLKGDLDAWELFDFDLLTCLSAVPAIGLIGRLRKKVKIVSVLAGVAIIPSLGTISLITYLVFMGAA